MCPNAVCLPTAIAISQVAMSYMMKSLRTTKSYQTKFPSYSDSRQAMWNATDMMCIDSKTIPTTLSLDLYRYDGALSVEYL